MIVFIWNGRGLGDFEKQHFIKNAIAEHRLNFVRVQETRKEDFSNCWLEGISGKLQTFGCGLSF